MIEDRIELMDKFLLPRAFDKEHSRCELVILMHGFLGSMKAASLMPGED